MVKQRKEKEEVEGVSSNTNGNSLFPTFKALGIRKDGKQFKVELVEYTVAGTCTLTEIYSTSDSFDAFDRFKIISAREMQGEKV